MAGREQLGPYTLTWPDGVFPLGQDTLALGGFATVRPGWRVCDLGTGSGALLLLLARRQGKLSLHGVELDPLAARTARENLEQNGLEGTIVQEDQMCIRDRVNSALVTAISLCVLIFSKDVLNGMTLVVIGLMSGFSLFGKNFVNIWPILLGLSLIHILWPPCWSRTAPCTRAT